MPKEIVAVTKINTLEVFMKKVTKLKISDNVLEDLIGELNDLVTKITKQSEKSAKKLKRKTIMAVDLEKAIKEILGKGALTVDELVKRIEPLPVIELSKLSKEIKKKAEDLLKPKKHKKKK